MDLMNCWYHSFKSYLVFVHEALLVRRRYTIGMENIPKEGERFFIVCNHQNTANDPLNIVFGLPVRRHICAMARANVFSVNPQITRFLKWIGLLPAFRLGWEGGEGLEHNFESFDIVAERINGGYPVIVFPEAGHTQGHWLDPFTTGTVRMAFHAAKKADWKEDIKIVPTAHHYSDYFDVQTDFLWKVARPISLKPYYKEFQEHPNAVMRKVTRQMRDTIQEMMLDEGKDDYEAKDFLRTSALNSATLQDIELPERLELDKAFVAQLIDNPEYAKIIDFTEELRQKEASVGVDDVTVEKRPSWLSAAKWAVVLLLLLPLWIVSLWPHGICYYVPTLFLKTDKMFRNSYRAIMSLLMLYPLAFVVTVLVMGLGFGMWWQALVWIALWIPLGKFSWWYYKHLRQLRRTLCYLTHKASVRDIERLRGQIRQLLVCGK